MKISLRQLSYIVAAARNGSISKAAEEVNISTSSVLAAIDAFEHEFKIQIFVRRRSKGLMLTEEGTTAIARTIRLLDEAAAYEEELYDSADNLRGELRVAVFNSISPNVVPQIIRNLRKSHPDLIVHLSEGDILSIQHSLRDGAVDVILTYDAGISSEFSIETLAEAPPHVVLAQGDPLLEKDVISLHDLAERPLLLLNLPQSRNYVLSLYEQAGIYPRKIHKLESFEMVRSSAAAGLGIAILNIRPPYDTTYCGLSVACRPLLEAHTSPKIVLASRSNSYVTRRVVAFSDYCRQFFATDEAQKVFVRAQ